MAPPPVPTTAPPSRKRLRSTVDLAMAFSYDPEQGGSYRFTVSTPGGIAPPRGQKHLSSQRFAPPPCLAGASQPWRLPMPGHSLLPNHRVASVSRFRPADMGRDDQNIVSALTPLRTAKP